MEKDIKANQKTRKIKIFRTIQTNKRTISSQQGHYHIRSNRKYTLENQQTKKNLYNKNSTIGRKNQSLPKTLTALCMYNSSKSQKNSRRQGSISQIKARQLPDTHKNKFIEIDLGIYKNQKGQKLSQIMRQAEELYSNSQFKQAKNKFQQICRKLLDKCPKATYFLGICEYQLQNYNNCIMNLSKILNRDYEFTSQGYLALADSYDKTKNYLCSSKILDQWLRVYKSQIGFLMRARINFYLKQYQRAITDYMNCYQINPKQLQAYIEEAQATFYLEGLDAALEKYNNLLVNYKNIWPEYQYMDINYVKYKKSLLLLQQKKYSNALGLLNQVTNPQIQSQINYYIGIINSVMGKYDQGMISFSRSIEKNTSEKFVLQSYYQKFVLMFKRNNFYGIQHQLDMMKGRYIDNQPICMVSRLVQGIILILKMNFKSGIEILNQISEQNQYYLAHKHVQKVFRNTIISFKSFAFYSIQEFQKALKQIEGLSQKYILSSESNLYNYTMLKGILQCFKNQYSQSFLNFQKAQKIQPFNDHTIMIKAIAQILFYLSLEQMKYSKQINLIKTIQQSDKEQQINNDLTKKRLSHKKKSFDKKYSKKKQAQNSKKQLNLYNKFKNQEILLSAQELLNRCLLKQPQNDQILCILATLYYSLEEYETGLKYIRKAIEVSDDHMIRHYYVKANLKIQLNMISQAISDYSNAILVMSDQQNEKQIQQKQEKIMEVYLERAKCYILQGMTQKAQADLKTFFNDLQIVRKYEKQLYLFMHVGCTDIILDIYQNILNKQYNLYNRMKCYYLSKQLNNCLTVMNALLDFEDDQENNNVDLAYLSVDRDCLQALKKSSQGSLIMIKDSLKTFESFLAYKKYGSIFKRSDCLFFAGVLSFYSGQYSKAKNYFIDSKGEKLLYDQMSKVGEEQNYENKTYNIEEINYNIGICDFIQGKWSPYLDSFSEFKRYHQSVTESLVQDNEEMTPFPIKNRLCSIYGPQNIGNFSFRLSFCLPELKLQEVKFEKNPLVLKMISFKDINMRPSAPWIHKNHQGIIFTDQIEQYSVDLKSETSRKNKSKKAQNNRYKQQQI